MHRGAAQTAIHLKSSYGWGSAASPALHDGRLFLVNDNDERAELLALDAKTGKEVWRVERAGYPASGGAETVETAYPCPPA